MSIVVFRPYKNLKDKEIIMKAYKKIELLRLASDEDDEETYNSEIMIFNEMIKEIKLRNLKMEIDIFINTLLYF